MMSYAHLLNRATLAVFAAILTGCASSTTHAPITEPGASGKKPAALITEAGAQPASKFIHAEQDLHAQTYVVQKGDTLYGIAFSRELDYHEIAAINNIQNPDLIQAGQELRLPTPASGTPATAKQPVKAAEAKVQEIPVKSQPQAVKQPYSEEALAKLEKAQAAAPVKPEPVAVKTEPVAAAAPEAAADNPANDEALEWSLPAEGKVITEFSESANQKGIDIAGKAGQAVVASAAGKVVYSGTGLRGYGKLVIIKHNNTYLSAYAHNDQILVKEGQMVTRGQKIAEMGNTDSDRVKLHFEIRKLGKPVDPAKYLPPVKS
jgi:lipoprotein NlpD